MVRMTLITLVVVLAGCQSPYRSVGDQLARGWNREISFDVGTPDATSPSPPLEVAVRVTLQPN